jgi:hypothetical protein
MGPNLRNDIVEFLNAAATAVVPCHECGGQVEYQVCTFFYNGQAWEIPLPFCRRCFPARPIVTINRA